jgi:hypothetical protein
LHKINSFYAPVTEICATESLDNFSHVMALTPVQFLYTAERQVSMKWPVFGLVTDRSQRVLQSLMQFRERLQGAGKTCPNNPWPIWTWKTTDRLSMKKERGFPQAG